jgi:hypothetical protein
MSGLPRVVDDVRGWYAATTLALGERTGLLEALLAGGGTAADLATRAGVDRRNAAAWADAMVAAGYAGRDGERYVPDEAAVGPLRGGVPFDMRAVVGFLAASGTMLARIEAAIRDGAGIPAAELQAALGELPSRINAPMYDASSSATGSPASRRSRPPSGRVSTSPRPRPGTVPPFAVSRRRSRRRDSSATSSTRIKWRARTPRRRTTA